MKGNVAFWVKGVIFVLIISANYSLSNADVSVQLNKYHLYKANFYKDSVAGGDYQISPRYKIKISGQSDNIELNGELSFLSFDPAPTSQNPPIYIWQGDYGSINTYPDLTVSEGLRFDAQKNISAYTVSGATYQTVSFSFTPKEALSQMDLGIYLEELLKVATFEVSEHSDDYFRDITGDMVRWRIENPDIGQTYSVWATLHIIPTSDGEEFFYSPQIEIREYISVSDPVPNNNSVIFSEYGTVAVSSSETVTAGRYRFIRGMDWNETLMYSREKLERWDINNDNKKGLEEAIDALQVVSGTKNQ